MSVKSLSKKTLMDKEARQRRENRLLSLAGIVIIVIALMVLGVLNVDSILSFNPFQKKVTVDVGQTYQFNQGKDYEYFSSDDTIATIDRETGILYAKNGGTITVSIRSKTDGSIIKTYTVVIKSIDNVGWIAFEQDEYVCNEGQSVDTMVRTDGAAIKELKSSNYTVASIENGTASGLVTNCTDCRAIHIECKKEGKVVLSATSSTGAMATAKAVVSSPDKGWIKFEQDGYVCSEGQVFDTMITAGGGTSPITIKSFKSSDTKIATIESGTSSGAETNCVDCKAVHVTCKKAGTVLLSATSSTGVVASSSVSVGSADKGWIQYDQSTFTCKKGQIIDAMIRTGGASTPASVKSFSSNNTAVAIVENGTSTGAVTNCTDCRAVHITCKEEGVATLTATSSTGATTSSRVTVNPMDKGWIKFNQDSYTCSKGQVFDAMIRAGGADIPSAVTNYGSSNTSVATIQNGSTTGLVTNCIDCKAVHVNCKKEGTAILTATSSTGANVAVTVTVTAPDPGWIMYESQSYTCRKGQVINTLITAGRNIDTDPIPTVQSFASTNNAIATVEDGNTEGAVPNCYNCRAVHITCHAEGRVSITATSSTGAVGSSSVTVQGADVGTISYKKSSYTCKVGQVIDTMITASNEGPPFATVADFNSSNTNVVVIESGSQSGLVTNCINCMAVHFTCKKVGTAHLTARSSTGAYTTSSVTVSK